MEKKKKIPSSIEALQEFTCGEYFQIRCESD